MDNNGNAILINLAPHVDVVSSNGERLRVPKALLFAMQLRPKKHDLAVAVEEGSEAAVMVEHFREHGIPFKQCRYCGRPFAAEVFTQLGCRWDKNFWRTDRKTKDNLRDHEGQCVRELLQAPAHYCGAEETATANPNAQRNPKGSGLLDPEWLNAARQRTLH